MTVLAVIVFLGLLLGGAWVLYDARDLIRLGLASYKWPKTHGIVVDCRDASFTIPGIDRTSTGVVLVEYRETVHAYVYEVAGKIYTCSTYSFGAWADRAGAAYRVGETVSVYYDPIHPEAAVLRRGLQLGAVWGLIPIVGALVLLLLAFRN